MSGTSWSAPRATARRPASSRWARQFPPRRSAFEAPHQFRARVRRRLEGKPIVGAFVGQLSTPGGTTAASESTSTRIPTVASAGTAAHPTTTLIVDVDKPRATSASHATIGGPSRPRARPPGPSRRHWPSPASSAMPRTANAIERSRRSGGSAPSTPGLGRGRHCGRSRPTISRSDGIMVHRRVASTRQVRRSSADAYKIRITADGYQPFVSARASVATRRVVARTTTCSSSPVRRGDSDSDRRPPRRHGRSSARGSTGAGPGPRSTSRA